MLFICCLFLNHFVINSSNQSLCDQSFRLIRRIDHRRCLIAQQCGIFALHKSHMHGKGKRIAVIGGGAAGIFGAIRLAELLPEAEVIVFEKSKNLLSKVKVSGGGRCNVTHSCFEPKELVKFYPRGSKELLSPFFSFQPSNMIYWLLDRGVETHTEED